MNTARAKPPSGKAGEGGGPAGAKANPGRAPLLGGLSPPPPPPAPPGFEAPRGGAPPVEREAGHFFSPHFSAEGEDELAAQALDDRPGSLGRRDNPLPSGGDDL